MTISREKNELVIRIPENLIGISEVQQFLDYLKFRSVSTKSEASENDIKMVSEKINKDWWKKNKDRYIN